jgi:hypothetical protein
VIWFAAGVKIGLALIPLQQVYVGWPGLEGLFARSASSTTTCIGPVTGPTLTRTLVMIPRPAGGNAVSPVARFMELKEQLANWVKKNQLWSLQATWLFGRREPRFAPKVTADALDTETPESASAAAQAQTPSPMRLLIPRTRAASPGSRRESMPKIGIRGLSGPG